MTEDRQVESGGTHAPGTESAAPDDLWGDPNEAPVEPYFLTLEQVEELDFASLPAALCWASYAANNWAMDLAAGVSDAAAWMGEEQRDKGAGDDLTRALLIADACVPIEPEDLDIDLSRHAATMARGVWSHGSVGRAVACVERAESGSTLHLCIRGTDFNNHPSRIVAVARGVTHYFLRFYWRIEEYATDFEPLATALVRYASDPKNDITKIVLSGHSLGGAAAQTLMHVFSECSQPVHLVTFGSPGSGAGFVLGFPAYVLRVVRKSVRVSLLRLAARIAWFDWGSRMLTRGAALFAPKLPKELGNRLHFKHPADPVVRYPTMIYRRAGAEVVALNTLEIPTDGGWDIDLKVQGFSAHACSKYFQRILDMLTRALEDVAPFREPTVARKRFIAALEKACKLEAAIPVSQMNNKVVVARHNNVAKLRALPNSEEAIARLRKLPPPRASTEKIEKGRKMRTLILNLTKHG